MFSRFFIDRPIFAAVVSIFIVLAGLAAMRNLPIAQYPEIAPPVVTVQAVYPGASAETLEQTVAAPLENQITGVEKMIYMSSTSGSIGIVQIQVTFDIGADADQAALNVNNRVKQAEPRLPEEVRRQGVTVQKGSSAFLQVLAFYSPDGRYDNLAISNFVTLNVLDALKRVPGTTNVQIFGAKDYAMRIWVRPDRLTQLRLTPTDLIRALNEQNAQFAAGKVGQSPSAGPQELVYTITTKGRLADPKEFENIILRANPDGSNLRLKDVARVELASKDYEFVGRMNGREATLVGVFLLPGANALEVADSVVKTVDEIVPRFPQGMTYSVPYDTTRFVRVSIREVLFTLGEAMLLVVLVVFLFLQNWRATLIPIAAVPVSLIGCFAGLYMLGYSVNPLTLFGMVLALSIVVDDAIVVLENIERIMHEEHLAAREAGIKARREVAGPRAESGAGLWSGLGARGRAVEVHAGKPGARRGPGLLHKRGDPSGWRDARAHRQGGCAGAGGNQVEPEQPGRGRLHRLRFPRRLFPQQRRDDLRHAEALGRAQGRHQAGGRRPLHEDRRHQGRAGARLRSAADLRPRDGGRLRALPAGPRRGPRAAHGPGNGPVHAADRQGPQVRLRANALAPGGAAALRRCRPREGEGARRAAQRALRRARRHPRQLLRQRLQQVRPHLAGADVGRTGVPQEPRRGRRYLRALGKRRDDPAALARERQVRLGPRLARALQQPSRGEALRRGSARHLVGPGDRGGRAHRERGAARRFQLRLGRRLLSGEEIRRHLGACARARGDHGVPDPRRAVRALVAAALGAARAAFRHLRRARRGLSARLHQRCVFPDRPGHAARPRGEERHPDRAVRGTQGARRLVGRGLGARGCAPEVSPHPDDLACLRLRRDAARLLDRRGRRRAPLGRHRRPGRDDGGDPPRHLLRPAVLPAAP